MANGVPFSQRVRFEDWYDDVEEVEELMEAADRAATSAKQREFIDHLYETFEEYGMKAYLSYEQYSWLKDLSHK